MAKPQRIKPVKPVNSPLWRCKLCGKSFGRADTVKNNHLDEHRCPNEHLKPDTPNWHVAILERDYESYLLDTSQYLRPDKGSHIRRKPTDMANPQPTAPPNPTPPVVQTAPVAPMAPSSTNLALQHAPPEPSPLGPNKSQREKKESLKKREAHDSEVPANPAKTTAQRVDTISPNRLITNTAPTPAEFELPRGPIHVDSTIIEGKQFYELTERINVHKGFKFGLCIADPAFPHSQFFRYTESEPCGPRFSHQDTSKIMLFDAEGTGVANPKGFCAARANVGMQEGSYFWEIRVIRGIRPEDADLIPAPHVRIGVGRREASLEVPVGQDSYSYSIRDVNFDRMHVSRGTSFVKEETEIGQGDVIGFVLTLPSLELHHKVVAGTYNKAVDVTDNLEPKSTAGPDIIRDRAKLSYKGDSFYEQFEYCPVKELEQYSRNVADYTGPLQPNPNHEKVALRTLPFSSLKVYKNGKYIGEPFTDLLAFLPPASKFLSAVSGKERDSFDDGSLGYFPMVSAFYGSAVEINCGPHFRYPIPGLIIDDDKSGAGTTTMNKGKGKAVDGYIRPLSVRYDEQIAEDIVYDIIDEVDFWQQDGGTLDDEEVKEEKSGEWGKDEATDAMMIDPVLLAANAGATTGAGGIVAEGIPEDAVAGASEMADMVS